MSEGAGHVTVLALLRAERARSEAMRITVRVIDSAGELIRELTLDPSRCYQPISHVYDVHDVPTHVSGMC